MSLPPVLSDRLRTTLLRCDAFRNDDALAAVFVEAGISQWKAGLPEASNDAARIRNVVAYLLNKRDAEGENALVLFLRALSRRYDVQDALHGDLVALAKAVEDYAPAPDTPAWEAALQRYRAHVKALHGTKRVLGKQETVSLAGIYTDVYLLEQPQAARGMVPADGTRGQRRDGLELLKQLGDQSLVILGTPGAGKTTFLKHIALQAAEGHLGDSVPIFVYLREWDGDEDLLSLLAAPFADCELADPQAYLETLLRTGRALLLFDGLDEVKEAERSRLITELEKLRRRYRDCRTLLTCRTAATGYQFERARYVEVADFTLDQMDAFARGWFGEETVQAKRFCAQMEGNEHLQDLGRTPLLLGLLCLVFEEGGAFPERRSDLYCRALKTLFREWDDARNIARYAPRDAEVYHKLSLPRKHRLFAHIAHATFEEGETLMAQARLERLITVYMGTVPDAPARLDLEPGALLKAIEAQHGILVAHARSVYAFVHPTFQEYYEARYVVAQAEGGDEQAVPSLLAHAHEDRWREVIVMAASMLSNADAFFEIFLARLEAMVKGDAKLVKFLGWAERKAASVDVPYKPAAVRAFYAWLARDLDRALASDLALASADVRDLDRDLALASDLASDLALDLALDLVLASASDLALACASDLALASAYARDHALALACDMGEIALYNALSALALPDEDALEETWEAFAAQLRDIMIEHRDIGHEWGFTGAQARTLADYFGAARVLVKCLDVAYVTDRDAIEARLVVPPRGEGEILRLRSG